MGSGQQEHSRGRAAGATGRARSRGRVDLTERSVLAGEAAAAVPELERVEDEE